MIIEPKYISFISFLGLLFICSACSQSSGIPSSQTETIPVIIKAPEGEPLKGFALLELFTSEGCSSCPPADRLLRDVIEDAKEKGLEIYALSFHVDYWNRLGWEDPYSSSAYSERQRAYGRTLNSNIYTPQLVLNGKEEFLGSSRSKAAFAIKKALDTPVNPLSISFNSNLMGNSLSFSYKTKEKLVNSILNIAIVESGLSQEVNRGDNRGRTLRHDNVVRAFARLDLDAIMGRGRLDSPDDIVLKNTEIIVYVQEKGSNKVVWVSRYDLGT